MKKLIAAAVILALGGVVAFLAPAQMLSDPSILFANIPRSGAEFVYLIQHGKSRKTTVSELVSAPPINVLTVGAVGNGATDNATAFAAIFANTRSEEFFFPPGIYRLSCGHAFNAASAISWSGAGRSQTTIRLDAGCDIPLNLSAPGTGVFLWGNKSGVRIANLTIDMNSPRSTATTTAPIQFFVTSDTIAGPLIDNVGVINGVSPTLLLSILALHGTMTNPIVQNSYFELAAADTKQNQCIMLYTYQGQGTISGPVVDNNVCVKTAIQIDGSNGRVSRNDVSGFMFGQGIFTTFSLAAQPSLSCHDLVITENVIHDTGNTFDVNATPPGGFEIDCPHSLVSNNLTHDLGGPGFLNFADLSTFTGNTAYNTGAPASCPNSFCPGGQAGFFLYSSMDSSQQANSRNVTMIGNTAYDAGSGRQHYGFVLNASNSGGSVNTAFLRDNNFTGITQSRLIAAGLVQEDHGYTNGLSPAPAR